MGSPIPPPIECLFCETTFTPGRRGEDIVSDWYGKSIGRPNDIVVALRSIAFDGTVTSDHLRNSQTISAKEFRLADVCQPCNNGPLSAIERGAQDVLLGLMRGTDSVLQASDQRLIAVWAQLKAICYDAAQLSPILPRTLARQFLATNPIGHFGVMLGKYECGSPVEVSFIRHDGNLSLIGGRPVRVLRTTVIFGYLLLSTAIVVDGWAPVEFLVHRDVAEAVDIWPPRIGKQHRRVSWPPQTSITAQTLSRIV